MTFYRLGPSNFCERYAVDSQALQFVDELFKRLVESPCLYCYATRKMRLLIPVQPTTRTKRKSAFSTTSLGEANLSEDLKINCRQSVNREDN